MKTFVTVCFFAFVVTQYVAANKCMSQPECPDTNQCCAGIPPFGGNCQNRTLEGEKCHVVDKMAPAFFGDYMIVYCPCAEGLICVTTGGKKMNDGICTLAPTPTPTPEVSDEPAGDGTPAEEPAGDDNPAEEPAGDSSAGEEPAGDSSAGEEPAGDSSAGEEPAGDSSAGVEPAGDSSAGEEPAADSSSADAAAEA